MARILKDPLLQIANAILLFGMGLMALAAAACTIAIPVMIFNRDKVLLGLAEEAPTVPTMEAVWLVIGIIAFIIAMMVAMFAFLQRLRWIVKSVGASDPFVPENAAHLTTAAWLMLGIQILSIPAGLLALRLKPMISEDTSVSMAGGDTNGLLLVLTLFILARVFRTGTRMREELEGTV
ncbi:MAG: DUF2975 domain-containing protein [Parerythrobacter sp.]